MSAPSRQFPVTVDTDGPGDKLNTTRALLIADPDEQHVRIFGQGPGGIVPLLDSRYDTFTEGTAPREVGGRHQFQLADGRTLYVMLEGGCGCGNPLKAFQPDSPPRSFRRLT